MNKLLQFGSQILAGELSVTEKFKYSMIVYPIAIVHAVYFLLFLILNIMPMAAYNLLSTVIYLLCTVFLRMEQYSYIYYIASGEIILNTILTSCLVGWDSGFSTFLFALAAAGFYISYTFRQHRISTPVIFGTIAVATYFSCYFYCYRHDAPYAITDPWVTHFLFAFNSVCTFAFITIFSILFMMEMRVSQKKLFEENQILGQIAGNDALTGLYNRWSMKSVLEQAIQSKDPFCLVMCDIDDFKKINDTYGHGCGDEVLKHISQLLSENIPKNSYVCRWGGEEFLLLLNGYSLASAQNLADQIRRTIAARDTQYEDQTITHTITMGIAHHHKNQTLDAMLARADMKLYIGKRQGKNVVVI